MTKLTFKQYTHFLIATAVMLFMILFPFPDSILTAGDAILGMDGRISLGIMFFCLYLWITEPVPFHITGCIGVLILTFFRISNAAGQTISFNRIVELGFGNNTVVFFIGVLTLSSIITKSGLGKRVSMFILSLTGNKTSNIILGFIITGAIVGTFITNMAVAAMLIPIAKSMLEEEGLKPLKSNFGRALMISCAFGSGISGVTTPAAAGPNIIAMDYMKNIGVNISFLEWMLYGIPAAALMIIPCWLLLIKLFKPEISHLSKTKEDLKKEFKELGPMNRNEIATTVIFGITVALWISSTWLTDIIGIDLSGTIPALICVCLVFLPGVTTFKWKEISGDISWDGIILIATGMSLGLVLGETGAAAWLANVLMGGIINLNPIILIFMLVMIVSLIKVGLSSNTVAAAVIMPVIIALVQTNNLPLVGILLPTALSLSLAFILVASSPTNLIPYSTGYFSITDMAKAGVFMTVISSVVIALVFWGIGSFTGLFA